MGTLNLTCYGSIQTTLRTKTLRLLALDADHAIQRLVALIMSEASILRLPWNTKTSWLGQLVRRHDRRLASPPGMMNSATTVDCRGLIKCTSESRARCRLTCPIQFMTLRQGVQWKCTVLQTKSHIGR